VQYFAPLFHYLDYCMASDETQRCDMFYYNNSSLLQTRGVVVHIIDTRKMISHNALQNWCLHMTSIERGKTLLQHHNNCIVIQTEALFRISART